jgi:hypothetical protein
MLDRARIPATRVLADRIDFDAGGRLDLSLPADHARAVARQYGCRRSTASASARWW